MTLRDAPPCHGEGFCESKIFSNHHGGAPQSDTRKCIITSQNHGFAVDAEKIPSGWHVWWSNANDGTVEGIRHTSDKFFAVQFHPEASPGPEDANYLFDEFLAVMRKEK